MQRTQANSAVPNERCRIKLTLTGRASSTLDSTNDLFVLVHSPLVGPATWIPVADELRRRSVDTVVPALDHAETSDRPFWEQHIRSVVEATRNLPVDRRLVLVGHSGAGALLPTIGRAVSPRVAAYVFVDAGIPHDGETRLGNGPFAVYIHEIYASGGRFPSWTDDDHRELIPDAERRRRVVAELRPPPLVFWEEPIPVFAEWPDAPCGFLRFTPNPAYDDAAAEARRRGWACAELTGGHFHMLVDPPSVADALLALTVGT
jgi:hypothetical protein